ncbi:uncharacterized protein V1510DRAFT_182632 [Dipodascopsis tothii]|uniref:uncharacterized protein n=1 Tax=Dipodascopsis tothii TaxID=44089 RepID=UPI0034CF07DB
MYHVRGLDSCRDDDSRDLAKEGVCPIKVRAAPPCSREQLDSPGSPLGARQGGLRLPIEQCTSVAPLVLSTTHKLYAVIAPRRDTAKSRVLVRSRPSMVPSRGLTCCKVAHARPLLASKTGPPTADCWQAHGCPEQVEPTSAPRCGPPPRGRRLRRAGLRVLTIAPGWYVRGDCRIDVMVCWLKTPVVVHDRPSRGRRASIVAQVAYAQFFATGFHPLPLTVVACQRLRTSRSRRCIQHT